MSVDVVGFTEEFQTYDHRYREVLRACLSVAGQLDDDFNEGCTDLMEVSFKTGDMNYILLTHQQFKAWRNYDYDPEYIQGGTTALHTYELTSNLAAPITLDMLSPEEQSFLLKSYGHLLRPEMEPELCVVYEQAYRLADDENLTIDVELYIAIDGDKVCIDLTEEGEEQVAEDKSNLDESFRKLFSPEEAEYFQRLDIEASLRGEDFNPVRFFTQQARNMKSVSREQHFTFIRRMLNDFAASTPA